MTRAIIGLIYYGHVVFGYFLYIYDMRFGVKADLKDKVWRRFEYNRFAGLIVIIGLTWINAYRLQFIQSTLEFWGIF